MAAITFVVLHRSASALTSPSPIRSTAAIVDR